MLNRRLGTLKHMLAGLLMNSVSAIRFDCRLQVQWAGHKGFKVVTTDDVEHAAVRAHHSKLLQQVRANQIQVLRWRKRARVSGPTTTQPPALVCTLNAGQSETLPP